MEGDVVGSGSEVLDVAGRQELLTLPLPPARWTSPPSARACP